MSHQTGIQGTSELEDTFVQCQNSDTVRAVKVVIEDETLVSKAVVDAQGDYGADFDNVLPTLLAEKEPCYVFFRLDSKNSSGYDFVFIAWTPDFAHVKSKMLYAATKATMKKIFGSQYIKEELYGTVLDDVSHAAFEKHLVSEAAPPPMTMEEIEKEEIRQAETHADISVSTRRQVATGVAFPAEDAAIEALKALKAGKVTYVQLSLDLSNEIVRLERKESFGIDAIAATIPDDQARYHVFNFQHSHEGDNLQSIVFVYSCPGYKCSVKERMMYSSCKGPLIDIVEDDVGVELAKKLEISDGSEFTQEWLYDILHPAKVVFKQDFKRPQRPGKGGRRLIRNRK